LDVAIVELTYGCFLQLTFIMNLLEELPKALSKLQTLAIANYIGDDKERFKELLDIFLNRDYRFSQRASAVLNACASTNPELIGPYVNLLLDNLKNPVHNAVIRNTIRVLQFIEIPEEAMGGAAEICFNLLQSRKEPVANRVFAMTVLYNISCKHPELKDELKLVIEDQLPYSSAAFKSRGSKILKKLTSTKKKAPN
jgi:hypothetical protein